MKALVLILMATMIASCSNNKKKVENKPTADAQVEKEKGINESDFIVDSTEGDLVLEDDKVELKDQPMEGEAMAEVKGKPNIPQIGELGSYKVKKGDTLMLVSFNIYGDYRKWKDIAALNSKIDTANLKEGTMLQYKVPAQKFVWNPQGSPYLIRRGDTLGTISSSKYGTDKRWRDLWENNKPLIIDPNLIFSGFTIYYMPDRDVASK